MELLAIIAFIAVFFLKNAAANEEKKASADGDTDRRAEWKSMTNSVSKTVKTDREIGDAGLSAAEIRKVFSSGGKKKERPSPSEIRDRHEARLDAEWEANEEKNRREREASAKRFTAARTRQTNAEQLHTVHVDSCEGRLESLKVLYDAGILDRDEYRARVERVKRQHREGRA